MAKARYAMGPNSASPVNYDTVMRASSLVEVGGVNPEGAGSATPTVFTVYRRDTSSNVSFCFHL